VGLRIQNKTEFLGVTLPFHLENRLNGNDNIKVGFWSGDVVCEDWS
jgi:hypothetical protein